MPNIILIPEYLGNPACTPKPNAQRSNGAFINVAFGPYDSNALIDPTNVKVWLEGNLAFQNGSFEPGYSGVHAPAFGNGYLVGIYTYPDLSSSHPSVTVFAADDSARTGSVGYVFYTFNQSISGLRAKTHPEGRRIDLSWTNPDNIVGILIRRSSFAYCRYITDPGENIYVGAPIASFVDGIPDAGYSGATTHKALDEDAFYYYSIFVTYYGTPGVVGEDWLYSQDAQVEGLSITDYYANEGDYVYNLLPRVFRTRDADSARGADQYLLKRYCRVLQGGVNLQRGLNQAMVHLGDPETMPAGRLGIASNQNGILAARSRDLGTIPERSFDAGVLRRIALSIISVNKLKGTCPGLVELTKVLTGWDSRCDPASEPQCGVNRLFLYWDGTSAINEIAADSVFDGHTPGTLIVTNANIYDAMGGHSGLILPHTPAFIIDALGTFACIASLQQTPSGNATITFEDPTATLRAEMPFDINDAHSNGDGTASLTFHNLHTEAFPWQFPSPAAEPTWGLNALKGLVLFTNTSSTYTVVSSTAGANPVLTVTPDDAALTLAASSGSLSVGFDGSTWGDRQPRFAATLYTGAFSLSYDPKWDVRLKHEDNIGPWSLITALGAIRTFGYTATPVDVTVWAQHEALVISESTAVHEGYLVDSLQGWTVNQWKDCYVLPNWNQPKLYRIVSNTSNTLYLDTEDTLGGADTVAAPGSRYVVLTEPNATKYSRLMSKLPLYVPNENRPFVKFEFLTMQIFGITSVLVTGGSSTITGLGFVPGMVIDIDGVELSTVYVNSGQITFTALPHSAGPVPITLIPPTGDSLFVPGSGLFGVSPLTYVGYLIGITPSHGTAAGGTPFTLTGAGLTGTLTVSIGGAEATSIVVVDDNTVTGVTAAHAAGAGLPVNVGPYGGALMSAYSYDAISPPSVVSITPSHATEVGGTAVTITGDFFLGATGADLGGVPLTSFVVVDVHTITGITGADTVGTVDVNVTSGIGTGTLTNGWTYDLAPFLYWKLNEATAVYNNLGFGGTAQLTQDFGGAALTPHVAGPGAEHAADFAGAAIATVVPNGIDPPGGSFSYAFWIYRRSGSSGSSILLSKSFGLTWPTSGNYGNGIVLTPANDGTWEPGFYLAGGGVVYMDIGGSNKIPANVWTHCVVTFDGSILIGYLNGAFAQSVVPPGTLPRSVEFNGAAGKWMSGGNAILHGADTLDGKLYGLTVYNVALSSGEVAALAAEFSGGWDYPSLPGLTSLFKAEIGVSLAGSNVASWADQSGAGINPTYSAFSNQPLFLASGINGLADIQYNGTTHLDGSGSVLGGTEITLFCIFQTSTSGSQFISGMHYNAYHYGLFINRSGSDPGKLIFVIGPNADQVISPGAYDDGAPHCAIVTSDGTTLKMYVDDTSVPVATAAVTGTPIAPGSGDVNIVGAYPVSSTGLIGQVPLNGTASLAATGTDLLALMTKLKARAGI